MVESVNDLVILLLVLLPMIVLVPFFIIFGFNGNSLKESVSKLIDYIFPPKEIEWITARDFK